MWVEYAVGWHAGQMFIPCGRHVHAARLRGSEYRAVSVSDLRWVWVRSSMASSFLSVSGNGYPTQPAVLVLAPQVTQVTRLGSLLRGVPRLDDVVEVGLGTGTGDERDVGGR